MPAVEGDVIVSAETAIRAAPIRFGWAAADELLLYVVHGTLHLRRLRRPRQRGRVPQCEPGTALSALAGLRLQEYDADEHEIGRPRLGRPQRAPRSASGRHARERFVVVSMLAWLVVALLASIGTRSLRRFTRGKMDELLPAGATRPLFSQIVELRDRAALAAESLQVLATLRRSCSAQCWQVRSLDGVNPLAWLASAELCLAGLLLLWLHLVWLPTGIARLWADAFVLHSWTLWKTRSQCWRRRFGAPSCFVCCFAEWPAGKIEQPPRNRSKKKFSRSSSEGEREGLLEEEAREMIEGVIELGDVTVAGS